MEAFVPLMSIYITFGFIRLVYRLSTGFLYTSPLIKPKNQDLYMPLVSVVIPAWNEEVGITKTVTSIITNGYRRVEVIIVDDGSTDGTARKVQQIAEKYPHKITLISQDNTGKAGALNKGMTHANGSLIMTVDADSYLERGSIRQMVNALADDTYSVAIGEIVVGNTTSWIGRAQHYEYSVGFHAKRAQHVFDSAYIFPGALTMFRSSVLREVGEFTSYSCTEDLDISMRIKLNGHKVAYVDSALCITEGATTIRGLINQRTRWRHGYLVCLAHRREFLTSPQKGWYLTLVDLPLQLIGIIEVLLLPFILLMIGYLLAMHANPFSLIAAYCIVPFMLLILADVRGKHKQVSSWVFMMPIVLVFIEIVGYIVPLGTTNNFARSLNLPIAIEPAVARIAANSAIAVDLGRINARHFTNVAGVGMSAEVASRVTERQKKRFGRLAYVIVGAWVLVRHKPFFVTVADKDDELQMYLYTHQLIIANGKFHAGKRIAQDAKLDSRELLVFPIGGRSRLSFLWHMIDFYVGKRKSVRHTSYLIARDIRVTTEQVQPVELDGEVRYHTPLRADVRPQTLRVRYGRLA